MKNIPTISFKGTYFFILMGIVFLICRPGDFGGFFLDSIYCSLAFGFVLDHFQAFGRTIAWYHELRDNPPFGDFRVQKKGQV